MIPWLLGATDVHYVFITFTSSVPLLLFYYVIHTEAAVNYVLKLVRRVAPWHRMASITAKFVLIATALAAISTNINGVAGGDRLSDLWFRPTNKLAQVEDAYILVRSKSKDTQDFEGGYVPDPVSEDFGNWLQKPFIETTKGINSPSQPCAVDLGTTVWRFRGSGNWYTGTTLVQSNPSSCAKLEFDPTRLTIVNDTTAYLCETDADLGLANGVCYIAVKRPMK